MRVLYVLVGIVALLYLLYFGYFFSLQRSILFPRHVIPPAPDGPPAIAGLEQMWLETSVGRVEAWYLAPLGEWNGEPAPLLILAHGNGDLIDHWPASLTGLREMGIGVLLVEFPGYGRSQGSPSQRTIRETFLIAYDAITQRAAVDRARIALFGHSVGGGAVSILAAERPSAALIYFSAFTSVGALAARQGLPGFAARDPFNNLAVVRNYPNPVLVIHGTHDQVIPYSHGVALHAAAQQGELITLECDHGGCVDDWARFWRELRPFFMRAGVLDG